jgi:hypothetical protein
VIHQSIKKLAKSIESLVPLDNNPRRGDIDAIAASYAEFGQVKPIVVKDNEDGTFTVIAGNHQVEAAKKLGWTEIAAVVLDADDDRAVAFALADNRTMELGHSEQAQVIDLLSQISTEYSELLTELKWDEFEMAALDEWADRNSDDDTDELENGYVPPPFVGSVDLEKVDVTKSDDGETKLTAKEGVNSVDAVTRGSAAVGAASTGQAVVQYTLVFDNPDQQKDWYSFIRFLRSSPVYEGDTTAERLMNFIQSHADF